MSSNTQWGATPHTEVGPNSFNQQVPSGSTAGNGAGNNAGNGNQPPEVATTAEGGWNRGNTPQNNPANWPQLGGAGGGSKDPHDQLAGMMSRVSLQNQQQNEEANWASSKSDQPDQGFHGWGKPSDSGGGPPNPAQAGSGWGAPSGWGAASNQGPMSNIDNGTAVWGKSTALQDQGTGWGSPAVPSKTPSSGQDASQLPAPSSSSTATPPVAATSAANLPVSSANATNTSPTPSSSTITPQTAAIESSTETQSQDNKQTSSSAVAASGASEMQAPGTSQANVHQQQPPAANDIPNVAAPAVEENPVEKLINSHEGWGKVPISQTSSWNIVNNQSNDNSYPQMHRQSGPQGGFHPVSNGTEAWGKPSAGQLPPTGNWDTMGNMGKKNPGGHWGGNNYGSNSHGGNWGGNQPQPNYNQQQNSGYGGNWNDQRGNQPQGNNDRWGDQMNHQPPQQSNHGGWGSQPINQKGGWGQSGMQQPPPDNNRNWNMGGGKNSRFGQSGGNNWGQQNMPQQSMDMNYRQNDMMMNQHHRPVDDGTGAWGDPSAYKEVHMWNRSGNNLELNPAGSNPNSSKNWGGMPSNNQPAPKGWGDAGGNPSRSIDNGTSVWMPKHQQQSQPLDKGGDWMKHADSQVWNQASNKPSGAGGWGQSTADYGDNVGSGWGQQKSYPKGNMENYHMGSMNRGGGMNRQSQPQQPNNVHQSIPPPSAALNQQFQAAVQAGIIPNNALHPMLMTSSHISNLVNLISKNQELQSYHSRMQQLTSNKMNMPGVRNPHEGELIRVIQTINRQIEVLRNNVMKHTSIMPQHQQQQQQANKMNNNHDQVNLQRQLQPNSMGGAGNLANLAGQPGAAAWKQQQVKEQKMQQQAAYQQNDNMNRMNLNNFMLPQDPSSNHNNDPNKYDHGMDVKDNRPNSPIDIGPPEFTPGVPWAGLRTIDPETDPNITPGSAANHKSNLSIVNQPTDAEQLLSKRERGQQPLTSESSNPVVTNGGNGIIPQTGFPNHENDIFPLHQLNNPTADRWSNQVPPPQPQQPQGTWLVLTNFTNGVDADAVKEMCARHGNVLSFQAHYPIENMALVRYSTQEEAANAKKALHITRVGSAMLLATVSTDQEVENFHSAREWSGATNNRFTNSTGGAGGYVPPSHQAPSVAANQPRQVPTEQRMVSPVNPAAPGQPQNNNQFMWNPIAGSATWPTASAHGQTSIPWSGGGSGQQSMEENSRLMSPIHSLLPENLLGSEIM